MPTPAARISLRTSSNVSRMRASMIWQTSRRLTVRPASSPSTDTEISSSSWTWRRSHVPWLTFSSSATWRLVLSPIATSLVTLLPPTGRTRVWNGEPVLEQGEVDRPGADVRDDDAEFLLGVGQDGLGRGQRVGHQLVDLDAGRADALGQVLDRGRGRRDDVRLDLEPQGAHPERVLDALLAVDGEPAALDVEHLAVGRDGDGARDVDGAVDVLAGDLAVVGGDRDLAGRVEALDVLRRRRRRRRGRSSSRTGARRARPRPRWIGRSGRC